MRNRGSRLLEWVGIDGAMIEHFGGFKTDSPDGIKADLDSIAIAAAINVGGQTVLPAKDTDAYHVVSPFASCRRKLGQTTWTAQLNINNLFDNATDQGTAWRYARWTDPRQIITTFGVTF